MPIHATRRLLRAALGGELARAEFRVDPFFGLSTPLAVAGVDPNILDPAIAWASPQDHAATARRLVEMFAANFAKFESFVDAGVQGAKPGIRHAA
jgi:phosphoenolpyruvate carboxykinase (ATP)